MAWANMTETLEVQAGDELTFLSGYTPDRWEADSKCPGRGSCDGYVGLVLCFEVNESRGKQAKIY
jgi:hypothetical protein